MEIDISDSGLFKPHQQEAAEKLIRAGGGIAWMRVGSGKSRVALATASALRGDYSVIVCIARRASFYDWQQEVATLQLDWKVRLIEDCPINGVYTEKTLILVSEGMIAKEVTQLILYAMYKNHQIGAIIVDEAWLFKNPKSAKHQAVINYTPCFPTVILSGSVMTSRNLTDIFGQVAAAGRQSVFGTLTKFRSQYMIGLNNGGFRTTYPKKGAYKAIMEKVEPFTYLYMPKGGKHETILYKCEATDQQIEWFQQLKEMAAVEDFVELNNMAAVVVKTQQISNGWLKKDNGEIIYFPSGKVDKCVRLVEELLETEYKVVIWCAFREDIERLRIALVGLKVKVATLQGGQTFDHEAWQKPDCRICLATEASGSSINHFAQVPYAIYFSQDFKWHSLQQSQGRHERESSEHDRAYYMFLHSDKSMDSQVYYTVRQSMHSENSVIRALDVASWLKS